MIQTMYRYIGMFSKRMHFFLYVCIITGCLQIVERDWAARHPLPLACNQIAAILVNTFKNIPFLLETFASKSYGPSLYCFAELLTRLELIAKIASGLSNVEQSEVLKRTRRLETAKH